MQERNFEEALNGLKDMEIDLFLNDNQLIKGVLLDVKQDHLVVDVNQDVFYFALQHIQALSKNAKDFSVSPKIVPYLDKNYLVDVLKALRYNWVSINSSSNQAISGVLSRISEDHITVISNTEQLLLRKSYISNINSNITENQIILLNNQQQLAIEESPISNSNEKADEINAPPSANGLELVSNSTEQSNFLMEEVSKDSQRERQVDIKPLQVTNEIGFIRNDDISILERHSIVIKELVNVFNELIEVNLKTEREDESNLSQLENHERYVNRQESAILNTDSHMDHKSSEPFDSLIKEDIKNGQQEEQIVVKNIQSTNEIGFIKNNEVSVLEKHIVEVRAFENDTNALLEVNPQAILEATNSLISENQLLRKPYLELKKKRILLTAWNTMSIDPTVFANPKNLTGESEFPVREEISLKLEPHSEHIEALHQPVSNHDAYAGLDIDEEFGDYEEKPEHVETDNTYLPVRQLSLKEEKEILKNQYLALMNYAQGNFINMTRSSENVEILDGTNAFQITVKQLNSREVKAMLEKQYYALMKHAAKMYHQLMDLR